METLRCKALVAGGGPAGLAAAALLAHAGVDTICVSPAIVGDPRTVALMQPALKMLERLGVWPGDIATSSAPLKQLHMVDDTGNLVAAPTLRFSAQELNLDCFGWNVPLEVLIPALRRVAEAAGVVFLAQRVIGAEHRGEHVLAKLEDGSQVKAQVAVAADGAHSVLRTAADIGVEAWSFDQDALVTSFSHSVSHQDVSTEWHKAGGPFTTVPLPGRRSSLVWLDKPQRISAKLEMDKAALAQEIQLESYGTLGLVSGVATPSRFSMRGVKAEKFAARRTLLVGEAAHVLPPVGAQGLNMSLRDAGHAVDVIVSANDPGADDVMKAYHATRISDVGPRQFAVNMMNRSLLSDMLPLHLLRAAGLAAVSAFPPLRALVMREGLAPSRDLPLSMR